MCFRDFVTSSFIFHISHSRIIERYHLIDVRGVLSSCHTIEINSSFVLFIFIKSISACFNDLSSFRLLIIKTVQLFCVLVQLHNTGTSSQDFDFIVASYFTLSRFFFFELFSFITSILSLSQKS
ncbi:hypothetical protein HOF65_00505 [bacterium]|nr:hypothetical protein [bacterium]MBT3852528.1 hypothetical protein [bacterium]MBT4632693.1 hypothetical protein [bacterium]MBT6778287.1 hypothetical protein [bacterium]